MTLASDLIDRVREGLEDYGTTVTDRFTGDSSTTIWQASNPPVESSTDIVTVAGVAYTDYTVNNDNGEFLFATAPGAVTVQIQYTKVLYRDSRILSVLGDAVRRMYPRVYKVGECYVAGDTQKFNYALTSTTDVPIQSSFGSGIVPADYVAATARTDLAKPQTRIHRAEFLPVGGAGMMSWRPFQNIRRTTAANLSTDTALSPGDVIKLIYSAPCTVPTATTDTIDVPDAYVDLPVWYALGVLLQRKESVRARADSYQATAAANANPPGTQRQSAADYMGLFNATLRDTPMRPMASEIRRSQPSWVRAYP